MKKTFLIAGLLSVMTAPAMAQQKTYINHISGKVSMIESRVNAVSAHYAVVRLKSVKVMGSQSADAAVVFAVPKDKDNAAGLPTELRKAWFQGQSCLDLAKQAFAMGKSFFVSSNGAANPPGGDNRTVLALPADGGSWFAGGTRSFIVERPDQNNAMWVPASCGIEN